MPAKDYISNFIGKKYNRVTILYNTHVENKKRFVMGACDCGVTREFEFASLKNNMTKSCGCLRTENNLKSRNRLTHNLTSHPLYLVWSSMKDRCYCVTDKFYPKYGGRGVTVCDEWKTDFKCFYDWAISNGWVKGLQLDKDKRSDNHLGVIYSPETCCFLTRKENMRFRSTSVVLEYNGQTKNLSEWCELLDLCYDMVRNRIQRYGWSTKTAFEKPCGVVNNPKQQVKFSQVK